MGSGSAGRSDQADAIRQHRQRLLSLRREKAFGFEALFQLLEGQLQRAESDGLDAFYVDLIFAARFINAERAAHGDVQAVFKAELHGAQLGLEADHFYLRAVVLQGAVDVARLRFVAIGNFAFDPDVREVFGQQVADFAGQFADGEDAALGHQVEGELAHGT